jgi:hypothetical protein
MGLALCAVAFLGTLVLSQRSLGSGAGLVLFIGCVYGWLRCWFYAPASHFVFDSALLGFYIAAFGRPRERVSAGGRKLQAWAISLGIIPLLVLLGSPLIDGQPFAIQIVGLRSVLLFLPLIIVATWFEENDLQVLSDWALACVLVATAFVIGELIFGVEKFFPLNSASKAIFDASDAGANYEVRLPASFVSSHAYGGTMVALIPLLVFRLDRLRRFKFATQLGLVAAASGAFLCSARIPVLILMALVAVWTLVGRQKRNLLVFLVLGSLAVWSVVKSGDRFRRVETLGDPDTVETRIATSVNRGLVDVVLENPLGRGLASATGTSIPYFLADEARPQEGLESEYSRLALELGVAGLLAWVSFVLFCLALDFRSLRRFAGTTDALMWTVCVSTWICGAIGAGVLTAVPGTFLLILQMTLVGSQRVPDLRAVSSNVSTPDRLPSAG